MIFWVFYVMITLWTRWVFRFSAFHYRKWFSLSSVNWNLRKCYLEKVVAWTFIIIKKVDQKIAKIENFKFDHSKKLLNIQNTEFLYRKSYSKFDGFWWLSMILVVFFWVVNFEVLYLCELLMKIDNFKKYLFRIWFDINNVPSRMLKNGAVSK